MLRRLLLALPAVAVGIVLWGALGTGRPAPVLGVRVVGGPTRGASVLAWQISVQRLVGKQREPSSGLPVRVLVDAGSERATWAGTTDAEGRVEARVQLAAPLQQPARVRVEAGDGRLLAEGQVELHPSEWRRSVRRQGGWLPGEQKGELWIRVWPVEGTLVVSIPSELLISVTHGPITYGGFGEPSPGALEGYASTPHAELDVELSGAELTEPKGPLRTDERGQLRLRVRPLEHTIRLRVRARLPSDARTPTAKDFAPLEFTPGVNGDPRSGEWFGVLPVTPGALHATLAGTSLLVRSPVPRDRAFVSLIGGLHRVAGYTVALKPDAEGGASASVPLDADLLARHAELRAVVSPEPDKRSPSTVGWQIKPAPSASPASTFDVADRLLLDNTERALQRERAARLERRRVAAWLLTLLGAVMIALFFLEARLSARRPAPVPAELALRTPRWPLALALACLLLGLGALAHLAQSLP